MAQMILFAAISAAVQIGISYLFPAEGPRMRDLKVSASTYGVSIPKVYGTTRVAGNLIWSATITEKKKKKSGKGGGYYTQYSYFCDFAMAFCEGPAVAISKIWADSKLIFDNSAPLISGGTYSIGKAGTNAHFYMGLEDQLPDPIILGHDGAERTPGYRGLVYIVTQNFPLADYGNRIPTFQAEVTIASLAPTVDTAFLGEGNGQSTLFEQHEFGSFDTTLTSAAGIITVVDPILGAYYLSSPKRLTRESIDFEPFYIAKPGISRYNMFTGTEELYRPYSEMGFNNIAGDAPVDGPDQGWLTWPFLETADVRIGYVRLIGITRAGYLIAEYGRKADTEDMPLASVEGPNHGYPQNVGLVSIDPTTLTVISDFLYVGQTTNGTAPPDYTRPTNVDSKAYYAEDDIGTGRFIRIHATAFDFFAPAMPNIMVFTAAPDGTISTNRFYDVPNAALYDLTHDPRSIAIGPASPEGTAPARWLMAIVDPPSANPLSDPSWSLYLLSEFGVEQKLFTKSLPEASFNLTEDILYDLADPGVIVSWLNSNGSGDINVTKIAIDTWEEIYSVVLPGQAGDQLIRFFPGIFPGFSSVASTGMFLNGSLGYVSTNSTTDDVFPVFFMFNTVTGEPIQSQASLFWPSAVNPDDIPHDSPSTGFDGNVGLPTTIDNFNDGQSGSTYWIAGTSTVFSGDIGSIIEGSTANIMKFDFSGAATASSLGSIIEDLLRIGGLEQRNFDLTPLYDVSVTGYGFATQTDVKNIIDELRRLYLFDLVETDGKLVAVMRGGDPLSSSGPHGISLISPIPQAVLGSSSPEAVDFWTETRTQEAEVPESFSLSYLDPAQDYMTSMASSKRIANPLPTMFSRQQVQLQVNVVLSAAEAKNIVNRALYVQWMERVKHETILPWAYLHLDATDTITVDMDDGRTYIERIQNIEDGADFARKLTSYGQDSGAYTLPAVSGDGGGTTPPTISGVSPAQVFVVNTTLLQDSDDAGGSSSIFYLSSASQSSTTAFRGASIQDSLDNISYSEVLQEPVAVEYGVVVGTVPIPPRGCDALDISTSLTVFPGTGGLTLESITDLELWNGSNAVVIGYEVIQFRDALLNSNGSYTLTNLLRGRRGTEWAAGLHTTGEKMLVLDTETVVADLIDLSAENQNVYFKAVAPGQTVASVLATTVNYYPRDLMPYSPSDIRPLLQDNGDVIISFQRRTRLGGAWLDNTGDVPLQETTELYSVYVLSEPYSSDASKGALPTHIVRTYTGLTANTVTYTLAQQTTDVFDSSADDLYLAIFQHSSVVGRGFPGLYASQVLVTFPVSGLPWRAFGEELGRDGSSAIVLTSDIDGSKNYGSDGSSFAITTT